MTIGERRILLPGTIRIGRGKPQKIKMGESFRWLKGMEMTERGGGGRGWRWRWLKGMAMAQSNGDGPRGRRWPKGVEMAQGDEVEMAQGDGGRDGSRGWRKKRR